MTHTNTHNSDGMHRWLHPRATQYDGLILLGMLAGLTIFYRASYQLPITAFGIALFLPLALWRPDLALLFVPLTVPLAFMPKGIWDERFGIRAEGVRFPLHEIVLLITVGSVGRRWLSRIMPRLIQHVPHTKTQRRKDQTEDNNQRSEKNQRIHWLGDTVSPILPHIIFLLVGTAAVLTALPEGRGAALREWRWLIVEPLLFYALVRLYAHTCAIRLAVAFVAGGVLVGSVGVLQYWGLNVAPFIGDEVGFSDDIMFVEGVLRATSVYGHPNNLALFMERVWPVACVLALAAWDMQRVWLASIAATTCLLCIGGVYVAFSKGAQYGSLAALLVLVVAQTVVAWHSGADKTQIARRIVPMAALLVVFIVMIGSGTRVERLNVMGASSHVRVKTWLSALAMVRDHPLAGLGLDQFHLYYREYIDPSLRNTTEWYISHPHNLVLDVWLRMGIAGVLAFGWLLGQFYAGVWRRLAPVSDMQQDTISRKGTKTHRPDKGSDSVGLVVSAMPGDDARWAMALRVGAAAAMTAAVVHGLVDNFYFVPDLAFAFWLMLAWGE